MLCNIELAAEKRAHAAKLQDAFVPIHYSQFIP